MATYRFEVAMQYGKLHGHLVPAGQRPSVTAQPAADSLADLVDTLHNQLETCGVTEEDDTVIFRNVAYEDFAQLEWAVRRATY